MAKLNGILKVTLIEALVRLQPITQLRQIEGPCLQRDKFRHRLCSSNTYHFNFLFLPRLRSSILIDFAFSRYLPRPNHFRLGKIRGALLSIKEQASLTRSNTNSSVNTRRRTCKPTLGLIDRNHITYTHFPMSGSDYFSRLKGEASARPTTPSEGTGTARTDVLKRNLRDYKPTGPKMVSQSVNKTALHPGGVE